MYKEDRVQKTIVQFLKSKGYLFTSTAGGLIQSYKTQRVANSLGYSAGTSDIIVWIPNGTLNIEVKRPKIYAQSNKTGKMIQIDSGGKQSTSQKEFQAKLEKIPGHYYIVVDDVTKVIDFLKSLDY